MDIVIKRKDFRLIIVSGCTHKSSQNLFYARMVLCFGGQKILKKCKRLFTFLSLRLILMIVNNVVLFTLKCPPLPPTRNEECFNTLIHLLNPPGCSRGTNDQKWEKVIKDTCPPMLWTSCLGRGWLKCHKTPIL